MRSSFSHGDRVISYLDVRTEGKAAPARALILLHAFPLAAEMWRPQLAAVPRGWRFLAPDLRGFGHSSPGASSSPDIDEYAEDVTALLDRLEIDRAVVAGLSMGGYAAFALLRRAPERVAGLVLADTRAEADDEAARSGRDAMAETLAQGGPAAVFERMAPNLLGATTWSSRPDVVRTVRDLAVAQQETGIRDAIHRLKGRPDSTDLLEAVACPALVIVGDEDRITSVGVARAMHSRLPGAELAVIAGAGHLSNLEQPEAFNAALEAFLSRVVGV